MKIGNYTVAHHAMGPVKLGHYTVENAEGISLKAYGYNTQRGEKMAARRAESFAQSCNIRDRHIEARAIVATNRCPECGRGIKRNLSLTGWWQCEQLGAEIFRKHPELPPCHWQCFTE